MSQVGTADSMNIFIRFWLIFMDFGGPSIIDENLDSFPSNFFATMKWSFFQSKSIYYQQWDAELATSENETDDVDGEKSKFDKRLKCYSALLLSLSFVRSARSVPRKADVFI